MKKRLLGMAVFLTVRCYAQCPFTVNLTSSALCPGATLTAGTANSPLQIVWYKNGTAVSTVNATNSFNPNGITVAGQGGGGSAADQLSFPQGFYVDAAGNIYVSDEDNWRIEKYAPGSGTGVTVAGGNGLGSGLNQLNGAADVFVDASGNMYISDYGNFRILKWPAGASAGIVVAGGNGSGSGLNQFDFPVGIFVDAAGNIYVADDNNQRVMKWAPGATSGVVVAGGNGPGPGLNQFMYPMGVYVDAAGNIYVVDDFNARVMKWAPGATSGIVVAGGNGAGSAANQLNYPYGLWVDAAGDIFVADAQNNRVQEWLPGATSGITVAGGNGPGVAPNQMTDPRFIQMDAAGNLYVSEDEDNRVQEFTIQSTINNTYVAPAPGTYTAVVTNAAGCTSTSNAVVIQGPVTPTVSIIASANPVNSCTQVSFEAAATGSGSASSYQWQVNGGNVGTNTASFQSSSLLNGDVVRCILTANNACSTTAPVSSNTITMSVGAFPAVTLSDKGGVCTGDTLVISSPDSLSQIVWLNNSSTVSTVQATGSLGRIGITVAGGNGPGNAANQLFEPEQVLVDASGNVFVLDIGNFRVQKWAPGATAGVNVAGGVGDEEISPDGMAIDAADNLYISEPLSADVEKFPPGAKQGIIVAGGNLVGSAANQLNDPANVYVDAAGNVFVADLGNWRVQKWPPGATSGVTVAGGNGPGMATNVCYPIALFVDAAGNIYVDDEGNDRIQKWAPGATSGVTVVQGTSASGSDLRGFWVDAAGDIFAANVVTNSVVEYIPGAAQGIVVAGGNGAGSAANQLNEPTSVYVDAQGNIYVADWGNNRVQEFTLHSSIDTIYKTLAPGSYTAAVTTSGGCVMNEGPIVVNPTVTPAVTINASAAEICDNSTVSFTAVPVNGGTTPGYQWLVNGTDAGTNSSSLVTSSLSGDAQVSCVMTGNALCALASAVTSNVVAVQVDPLVTPSVSISAIADNICAGAAASFTATPMNGGAVPGYQWIVNGVDAGSNSTSFSSSGLANGSVISCTLAGSALCATTSTAQSNAITMQVNPVVVPVVAVSASADPICSGTEVNFVAAANGASDFHYQWQVDDANVGVDSSGYSTAGLKNGDVVLCTVSSGGVCVTPVEDSVAMTVNPVPVISPDQVFADQNGAGVTLQPIVTGDIASYGWTPATGLSADNVADPFAKPAATTVYTLSVVSADGCKANGEIKVKIYTDIRIPNAFTPNGDGRNDVFYVLGGPEGSLIKDFSVFDRWGQRVFRVESIAPGDPTYGWNGTIKGNPAPVGAYVYIVTISMAGGTDQVYKGTVMLIR